MRVPYHRKTTPYIKRVEPNNTIEKVIDDDVTVLKSDTDNGLDLFDPSISTKKGENIFCEMDNKELANKIKDVAKQNGCSPAEALYKIRQSGGVKIESKDVVKIPVDRRHMKINPRHMPIVKKTKKETAEFFRA